MIGHGIVEAAFEQGEEALLIRRLRSSGPHIGHGEIARVQLHRFVHVGDLAEHRSLRPAFRQRSAEGRHGEALAGDENARETLGRRGGFAELLDRGQRQATGEKLHGGLPQQAVFTLRERDDARLRVEFREVLTQSDERRVDDLRICVVERFFKHDAIR